MGETFVMVLVLFTLLMKWGVMVGYRSYLAQGKRLRQLQTAQMAAFGGIVMVLLGRAIATGSLPEFRWELCGLFVFAMVSACATLAAWYVAAKNQAVVSAFSQVDDLLSIFIMAIVLQKAELVLQPFLLIGMVVCFAGGVYLWVAKSRQDRRDAQAKGKVLEAVGVRMVLCIAFYSVVWAIDSLIYKWMTVTQKISEVDMMGYWYAGAVLATTLLRFRPVRESRIVNEKDNTPLTRRETTHSIIYGVLMAFTGVLWLSSHKLADPVIVRACSQAAEVTIGMLIGMYWLKQSKMSPKTLWSGASIVFAGAAVLVLGYLNAPKAERQM